MQQWNSAQQFRRSDGTQKFRLIGSSSSASGAELTKFGQQTDGGKQRQDNAAVILDTFADLEQTSRHRIDETGSHNVTMA